MSRELLAVRWRRKEKNMQALRVSKNDAANRHVAAGSISAAIHRVSAALYGCFIKNISLTVQKAAGGGYFKNTE